MSKTMQNAHISLGVDARGRLVSLRNKATGAELIAYPQAAEAWRMIVPTGRHTIDTILGSGQRPKIELLRGPGEQALVLSYGRIRGAAGDMPIEARFTYRLGDDSTEIWASVEIKCAGKLRATEVEFPVIGPMGGFPVSMKGGRDKALSMDLLLGHDVGRIIPDVLHNGLPSEGDESNHFAREHETVMQDVWYPGGSKGVWADFFCERQGLYVGYHAPAYRQCVLKIEKYPKEVPNAPRHAYPEGTPRWLRAHFIHLPQLKPGATWKSQAVCILPHEGDWHAGADRYSKFRHQTLKVATPPAWMDDFVGWTEIIGNLYTGEVFHGFGSCAKGVLADMKVTGINLLFYYGHTNLGAEGADYDWSPSQAMGGEKGFGRMVDRLHRGGCRIVLLDHLHRWINCEVPQYRRQGLERYAVRDARGQTIRAHWWKETALSCLYKEGPTPVWIEMCPACRAWREIYLRNVRQMIGLGVDGMELDTLDPAPRCYSSDHGHERGAALFPIKLDFLLEVRRVAKGLNPDFLLLGETETVEDREAMDGFYPFRHLGEQSRITRYIFPELRQQAVLVGNYAYDQVNKALAWGIGAETEIWGLRKTTLAGCPELARYIGEVNRFKRKYPDVLIHGTFRDTVGAGATGGVLYSVLEGANCKALVLRNPTAQPARTRATLSGAAGRRLTLWKPFATERTVRRLPIDVRLEPYEAAVLLAMAR
jgi:hypothetical protein